MVSGEEKYTIHYLKQFKADCLIGHCLWLHDFNCGLKAYKKERWLTLGLREMHRYIPVIAKQAGYTHIGEKVVKTPETKIWCNKIWIRDL